MAVMTWERGWREGGNTDKGGKGGPEEQPTAKYLLAFEGKEKGEGRRRKKGDT
jgi:hypothetical protein